MEISGNLWKFLAIYGNFWQFMEISGNLWKFLAIYGNFWQFMKIDFMHPSVV